MKRNGFTLLEMIVASSIMAVAVVGLMAGLSLSTRNAARLQDYERAVQLGRVRMNELLLDPDLPLNMPVSGEFDPQITGGLQAGWTARLTLFEMPPNPAPNRLCVDRLELQVWWAAGDSRRTFTLDGYRRRVLKPSDLAPVGTP